MYYQTGIALGLPPSELDSIRMVYYQFIDQAFDQVLLKWLRQRYDVHRHGPPTWRRLVKAVDSPTGGNHPALAMSIAEKHSITGRSMYIILFCIYMSKIKHACFLSALQAFEVFDVEIGRAPKALVWSQTTLNLPSCVPLIIICLRRALFQPAKFCTHSRTWYQCWFYGSS